jgi:2-keto-3-deoxy-L-fuconate dehydrogenase
MFNLTGKVAIITGGGSGIGKAISLLFAQQGATVHIVDLDINAANETVADIKQANGVAFAHNCNISDQQQVTETYQLISRVDILVNNAGIAHIGTAENTSEADFDRIYNVNVKGAYNSLHAAIPIMKANGGGVILNMASIAGIIGIVNRFAYSMSKGAMHAMTMSVAQDFLHDNIRCNSISPARIHTPFVDGFIATNYPGKEKEMFDQLSKSQPIGRMGKPEEAATLALYLCSDEAGFVTGCDYLLDGGFVKLK